MSHKEFDMQKENDVCKEKSHSIEEEVCMALSRAGFNFATGIPCGVLKLIIKGICEDDKIQKVSCQNEPEAVGIAAGAYLGGKNPLVYLQNSGLLKSTNEISSLLLPYEIPVLFISSYRGCAGEDAPQHLVNGRITRNTISLLEMSCIEAEGKNIYSSIKLIGKIIEKEKKPAVLLLKRGWTGEYFNTGIGTEIGISKKSEFSPATNSKITPSGQIKDFRTGKSVGREDALDAIVEAISEGDAVFCGTGLMSRSMYERHDAENIFYVTGSFGLVSSLGLGFASVRRNTRTIVVDGDASILSNFGSLVSIARENPKNLVHIILDNNAYASCSGEHSCSDTANIPQIASLLRYNVYIADSRYSIVSALNKALCSEALSMVYVNASSGGRRDFKRPLELAHLASRFKSHFQKQETF